MPFKLYLPCTFFEKVLTSAGGTAQCHSSCLTCGGPGFPSTPHQRTSNVIASSARELMVPVYGRGVSVTKCFSRKTFWWWDDICSKCTSSGTFLYSQHLGGESRVMNWRPGRTLLTPSLKTTTNRAGGGWMQVTHACNPSYSGGSHQEDQGSKPAKKNPQRPEV
jgi:hypothetical protein